MKKEDLPQDNGALSKSTKEVCYVKNDQGKFETALSTGWEVKIDALNSAWEEVDNRIASARKEVAIGNKSPIYYFMEKKLMDVSILAAYTGFFSFTVKRHFRPVIFKKLSQKKLEKYADIFELSITELVNYKGE